MIGNLNLLQSRLEIRQKNLVEELEQLKTSVPLTTEERREGSPFGKGEEGATESFELERRLALESHIRNQLTDVEHALHKFEEGKYGFCEECSEPVNPARLEALPEAKLCLSCKANNGKGRFSPG